ncbi:SMR family transporter [Nitrospira sp. Nam80]
MTLCTIPVGIAYAIWFEVGVALIGLINLFSKNTAHEE